VSFTLWLFAVGLSLAGIGFAILRVSRALRERPFRRTFLLLFAASVALAVGMGWRAMGGLGSLILAANLAFVTAVLTLIAIAQEWRRAPATETGSPSLDPTAPRVRGREARWIWAAVLLVSVLAFSYPIGSVAFGWEKRRAFAWVERAASRLREVRDANGTYPADLGPLRDELGRPPRLVAAMDDCGYSRVEDGFEFRIRDPIVFMIGEWTYDGATRKWSYGSD
jgi:hypothetical protein